MHNKKLLNLTILIVLVLIVLIAYFLLIKNSQLISPQHSEVLEQEMQDSKLNSAPLDIQATELPERPFVFSGKRVGGSNADLYKGYVIVEGEYYEYFPETLSGGVLFFKVDEDSAEKLPQKRGFAFDNESFAKSQLMVDESVFKNSSVCRLFGRAKISIEDFTVVLLESEVWNHTKLVKVLDFTPQTTETCIKH